MRLPDFVGSWSIDFPILESVGGGHFGMFIEEREKINSGIDIIKGTIEDDIGVASFEGEIDSEKVRFVKRYSYEAVSNGGAAGEIIYNGRKVEDGIYKGKYTVVKGTSNGIPHAWEAGFILERYEDPNRN